MYGDQVAEIYHRLREIQRQRPLSRTERLNLLTIEADRGILFDRKRLENVPEHPRPIRVAILSLLFNWPSTAGGIVHTNELADFLTRAGVEVCHFYAECEAWDVGQVFAPLNYSAKGLHFDSSDWRIEIVCHRFRLAVDAFDPDAVIVTDSWSAKPLLALAMGERPYFLRLAAMECICPLNNVRLLLNSDGVPMQCECSQLAHPEHCRDCVRENIRTSGSLQRVERDFVGFGTDAYSRQLLAAFEKAEGVLAVNPQIGALCTPYCRRVHVIPSGFDTSRFQGLPAIVPSFPFRILFAGVAHEPIKGYDVLIEACRILWQRRQDFELQVTADTSPYAVPFQKLIGWQTQQSLPHWLAQANCVVVPTIAQEALGRVAVEAMGAGRPVIASRIGGLPYTVSDGQTGILVPPGDPVRLAQAIDELIDHPERAADMGQRGREKFHREFDWGTIIRDRYLPLLTALKRSES